MEIRPCPECGQNYLPMQYLGEDNNGDYYRCRICRTVWTGDELEEIARKQDSK